MPETLTETELVERLEQIRKRREKLKQQGKDLAWDVNPFNCLCDEACKPFMTNAPRDMDFLLSLVDSKAATVDMSVLTGYEVGFKDAASAMRDKCVEAIKALPDHPALCGVWVQQGCTCSFRAEVIAALQSITVDQEKQQS